MGYFSYLYLIEADKLNEEYLNIQTTIFQGGSGDVPYFSWIPGTRKHQLQAYANGTIYSNTHLYPIEGYPVKEAQRVGSRNSAVLDSYVIEANFVPNRQDAGTVLQVILPNGYLPRKDVSPLVQPAPPFVNLLRNRIVLTWPSESGIDVRFCITPLPPNDNFSNYDLSKILVLGARKKPLKFGVEINLGVLKFKFG